MGIEVIEFNSELYPKFQSNGNSMRFCLPFALEVVNGDIIYDIGYGGNEEWKFPNSIGVDIKDNNGFDAYNLPPLQADAIVSAHCLEHLPNWIDALEYWASKIKSGGTMFLYLPDFSQQYWRVWNNRKHVHTFTPEILRAYLLNCKWFKNVFVSGVDAYNSFTCFCEKI